VTETLKMAEIRIFKNLDAISKKKYLENGKSYGNFAKYQKCSEWLSALTGLG